MRFNRVPEGYGAALISSGSQHGGLAEPRGPQFRPRPSEDDSYAC